MAPGNHFGTDAGLPATGDGAQPRIPLAPPSTEPARAGIVSHPRKQGGQSRSQNGHPEPARLLLRPRGSQLMPLLQEAFGPDDRKTCTSNQPHPLLNPCERVLEAGMCNPVPWKGSTTRLQGKPNWLCACSFRSVRAVSCCMVSKAACDSGTAIPRSNAI